MILENITWKSYLTVVAVLVIIYYAFLLLFSYRRNKKGFTLGGAKGEQAQEYIEGGYDQLEQLTEEIRHSILEEAGTDATKAELITQFRHRLVNYDGLRQPVFRIALTNFLIQKSESICGITFTAEELNEQWDTLVRQ